MIVGLTGTLGAGKGSVAEYLKSKGFKYHSCSDVLRDILKERGVEENIDNLANLGNELRAKHGPGVLGKKLLIKIEGNDEKDAIADSIRNPAEIEELKKRGDFVLLAIDAPIELRYKRISSRGRAGDHVPFEKFREQETDQLKDADPKKMQLIKCMGMADHIIINDSSLEELHKKVEDALWQKG